MDPGVPLCFLMRLLIGFNRLVAARMQENSWGEWLRQSDKLGQDVWFVAQNFERAAKWIRELAQVSIEIFPFAGSQDWYDLPGLAALPSHAEHVLREVSRCAFRPGSQVGASSVQF